MKKLILIVLTLGYCLNGFSFSSLSFIGSLPEAKYKAATEGKLYMVKFTASWCMPCKWMDKNTFSDPRVQNYITSNYVPVSIDVDDFDGMVIKQKYEVQVLPTIIIFNSKGEEVSRYAESLGPSRLLSILEQYNVPANNVRTQASKPEVIQEDVVEEPPLIISRPHLPKVITEEKKDLEITEVVIEQAKTTPEVVETKEETYTPPVITKPVYTTPTIPAESKVERTSEELAFLTGQGIFELDVKFQQKTGYSIQIGVYQQYNNVLSEVNKFKKKYGERVFVHIDQLNGATVYRLLLGHFQDANFAETKKIGLEANGVICYVRDLKTM